MGLVYVSPTPDWDVELLDTEPVARVVPPGGVYFALYPAIQSLHTQTGQLIDSQATAFFDGDSLCRLRTFAEDSRAQALALEPEWQQHVGRHADGSDWYQPTNRDDVVRFLDDLLAAIELAEQADSGLLFIGE